MRDDPVVGIRAFRGSRTSSVYREHELSASRFEQVRAVAARQGLPLLGSLGGPGAAELDKRQARRLADEAREIRVNAALPELDEDLAAIAELARWCGRAKEDAWLTVVGP